MQHTPRIPFVSRGRYHCGTRKKRYRASVASRRRDSLPYTSRGALLSKGEAAFFRPLRRALGGKFLIMSKVRLADLVQCTTTDWHRGFGGAISQKHVDFVLCDPHTTRFVLAIELDDRSHDAPHRQKRDHFLNGALHRAGIPLLRVRARSYYPVSWLHSLIHSAIDQS